MSYRYRGNVARIIIHKEVTIKESEDLSIENRPKLKNITTVKQENKIILAYSLKKIRTKPTEEYSILNPETSSDSPSAKSNGVRLVSAKSSTIQIIKAKGVIRQTHNLVLKWSLKFIEINKEINSITTKARLIS